MKQFDKTISEQSTYMRTCGKTIAFAFVGNPCRYDRAKHLRIVAFVSPIGPDKNQFTMQHVDSNDQMANDLV